jgi:hypothetical protein
MDILSQLAGGDMRTTGASDDVASKLVNSQELFDYVVSGLDSNDPGLRMRCSDVLEKVSRQNPKLLAPHKEALLGQLSDIDQQEVQWHVALMLPRLQLTSTERERAAKILTQYFDTSKSNIVKANALEALVELSRHDDNLNRLADRYVRKALRSFTPSLQARARKLVKRSEEDK